STSPRSTVWCGLSRSPTLPSSTPSWAGSSASSTRSQACSSGERAMPDPVHLLLVGTSHRHAPIAVREQLAAQAPGRRLIEAVVAEDAVIEAVGLSTCNRCELYMVGSDPEAMREAALRRLAEYAHRSEEEVAPLLYEREGAEAAEHLFEVAGGLDSLVPG